MSVTGERRSVVPDGQSTGAPTRSFSDTTAELIVDSVFVRHQRAIEGKLLVQRELTAEQISALL